MWAENCEELETLVCRQLLKVLGDRDLMHKAVLGLANRLKWLKWWRNRLQKKVSLRYILALHCHLRPWFSAWMSWSESCYLTSMASGWVLCLCCQASWRSPTEEKARCFLCFCLFNSSTRPRKYVYHKKQYPNHSGSQTTPLPLPLTVHLSPQTSLPGVPLGSFIFYAM